MNDKEAKTLEYDKLCLLLAKEAGSMMGKELA